MSRENSPRDSGQRSAVSGQQKSTALPLTADLIFLVGPSAVGKTAVAVELARRISGEIVSCDAMQVYREIRIASDKPSKEMLGAVPHHLLDVVFIEDDFNAARYRELALKAIEDIRGRGKVPVICGGSGMYMMALLDGLFESDEIDPAVRERLEAEADDKGLPALYGRLRSVDLVSAEKIKPNDRQRIVRALEVLEATGLPISQLQKKREGLWGKFDIRLFALNRPREELYARVEARIEEMFAAGLIDEVREILRKKPSPSASRLIGIPEVRGYLEGGYDIARAKDLMKRNTRHYVKRQLTWFRRDKRLEWISVGKGESEADVAGRILELLRVNMG